MKSGREEDGLCNKRSRVTLQENECTKWTKFHAAVLLHVTFTRKHFRHVASNDDENGRRNFGKGFTLDVWQMKWKNKYERQTYT